MSRLNQRLNGFMDYTDMNRESELFDIKLAQRLELSDLPTRKT